MGTGKYNTVSSLEVESWDAGPVKRLGGKGEHLYRLHKSLQCYSVLLGLYTISSYFAITWALQGSSLPGRRRVFQSGSLPISSFYAGVSLSAILTPAAILLRQLANDLSSLHPFALAALRPVRIQDLDAMMGNGVFSLKPLLRYSKWFAVVQAVLILSGATLVPIGTLILTVENFAPDVKSYAVVGLPTTSGHLITLTQAMGGLSKPAADFYGEDEPFMPMVNTLALGAAIRQTSIASLTPGRLGPLATENITFEAGVRYNGLVTFNWSHGCLPADDEIRITFSEESNVQYLSVTFPDGSTNTSTVSMSNQFVWSNSTIWTDSHIPLDGYTYIATTAPARFTGPPLNSTVDYSKPHRADGLQLSNDTWLQLVKCVPLFDWEISSCVWNDHIMDQCIATPGANTTELDVQGLNALQGYMLATVWNLQNKRIPAMIHPAQSNAITANQMDKAFGLVALALAELATSGYWGTATVTTSGQTPRRVYIARMPVLITVTLMLTVATILVVGDFVVLLFIHILPIRKTSLLTIATAVRGSWWDNELEGRCTLSKGLLRHGAKASVMFGVDAQNPRHIGFAPDVHPIDKSVTYYGIGVLTPGARTRSV